MELTWNNVKHEIEREVVHKIEYMVEYNLGYCFRNDRFLILYI